MLIRDAEKDATARADLALEEFGYKRTAVKSIYID